MSGATLSLIIRAESGRVGGSTSDEHLYNCMVTAHAFSIIFFFIMPAAVGGSGNWLLPLILNSLDMASPRLNNLRFWLVPMALFFIILSSLLGSGAGTG